MLTILSVTSLDMWLMHHLTIVDHSEQKNEKQLQIHCHVTQTALSALQFLLRLCGESTRRQTHLSLAELEMEMYRLDSVANYDATGDGVGATLLHVAAEEGNAELMSEVLRNEQGVDVSRGPDVFHPNIMDGSY